MISHFVINPVRKLPTTGLINLTVVLSSYIIKYKDEQNLHELMEILNMVISRIRYTPGCKQCDLWKSEEQHAFMVYEIWRTKADFDRYVNSILFKRFLNAVEMSVEQPRIIISECKNISGIEMIRDAMKNIQDPKNP